MRQGRGSDAVIGGGQMDDGVNLGALADLTAPWALRVAVTLGVPDAVGDEPIRTRDLAARVGADADALARLLRHLTCRGVFAEVEPGVVEHNAASRKLRVGDESGWQSWLRLDTIAHKMDRAVTEGLLASVRTGRPSYADLFGSPVWTDLGADPDATAEFDEMMQSQNFRWVPGVLDWDWSGVGSVVDVGGGAGSLVADLLERWPGLTGHVVDQDANVVAAKELFAERGLADRADAVALDFFESLPSGSDAYLLAHVVHDWNDEDTVRILRRCGEAAGPQGRVLVVERAVDAESNSRETTVKDLRMMTLLGGRERDLASLRGLAERAGLRERSQTPIQVGHYLLEYVPA